MPSTPKGSSPASGRGTGNGHAGRAARATSICSSIPPRWLAEAQTEFAYLLAQVDRRRLEARLAELLPTVDTAFFDACARSLRPGASPWPRVWLRLGLHRRLRAYAYRPPFALLARRVGRPLRLFPRARGLRLAHGGTVVALLGGDGAGKSTCVGELSRWLGPQFDVTTAHLGRPPRSLTTLVIGGLLKLRRALGRVLNRGADERGTGGPGVLELLRLVCTARDRYRLFTTARRFAAAGGIALCERYPTPQKPLLVGPQIPRLLRHGRDTPPARRLLRAGQGYYPPITVPHPGVVLMVEPQPPLPRQT